MLSSFSYLPLWLGTCGSLLLFSPVQAAVGSASGTFADTVTLEFQGNSYQLKKTGESQRKKFFVKVYNVASYLQDPESLNRGDIFTNILHSSKPKQLTLHWLQSVDKGRVVDGYRESFQKVGASDRQAVEQFFTLLGDVKKGDVHTIRWLPNGTVSVSINGREQGVVGNEPFARTLWSIWFGSKSAVDRNALVNLIN